MSLPSPPPIPATQNTDPTQFVQQQAASLPKGANSKGKFFSLASVIMAALGILPLLIFLIMAFESPGLALVIFFILGLIFHAVGIILGIVACFFDHKTLGIMGAIGNIVIMFVALFFFFLKAIGGF